MNWPFWLELLVRSGALLLIGEGLRRVSRNSTAAFRHVLLLWVFVLLAILPVLSLLFPELRIPIWTFARAPRASVTVQVLSSRMVGTSARRALDWPLVIWVCGFVTVCLPLFVGSILAWRAARGAAPIRNAALDAVAYRLRGHTEVLVADGLRVPMTCGLLRRRILLPRSAEEWSSSRLEAVLLHELAHVKRRDLAAQMGVHIVAALWWFQPLVWVLRRALRAESELACDAEVIRGGYRASAYAEELLGVAKNAGRDWSLSSSAIGMVRSHDLEQRLRAILHPPATSMRRRRIYLVGLVLGAASIAASAVSLRPDQSPDGQGGSIMKRTILSALLTSAGLSAATVSGHIHDSNGAAVADAKVSIYDPDKSATQEAVTGSDGKFSVSGSDAGQYILRVEKPGLASIFRAFDMQADSKIEREFTMASAGAATVADSLVGTADSQPKRVRVGGQVAQSNLVKKVQPVYPAAAKQAHVQGPVQLDAIISKDGVPVDLQVISSPSDDLSESSLEAVRQWRYRPTLLNGSPVEIETVVLVNYTLSQ